MSNFIVPNTFIPGTKAKAQEVNENFTSIQNELNSKATKTGDVAQTFFVAQAVEENQATTKKQVENLIENTKTEMISELDKNGFSLFAFSGNVNEDGKAHLITFSGMNLSFLVGGGSSNLLGNIQGTSVEITSVDSFSLNGYADGTYNIFVDKDGEITALANKVYIQPKEPTMVINDIWVNTSVSPNEIKQYNGTEKVLFEKIFIGKVVIKDSQIESVSTNPYNSKIVTVANHTNGAQVVETYQNDASGYRIYSDGFCEQWGQSTTTSGKVVITFVKPFETVVGGFSAHVSPTAGGFTNLVKLTTTGCTVFAGNWNSSGGMTGTNVSVPVKWAVYGYLADDQ